MSYEYIIKPLCQDWLGKGTIKLNGETVYQILKEGKPISTVPESKLGRIKQKLGDRVSGIDLENDIELLDFFYI